MVCDAAVAGYRQLCSPASNDCGGLALNKLIRTMPKQDEKVPDSSGPAIDMHEYVPRAAS